MVKEIGVIRKRWKDRVSIALVFPNEYQIGMANLGVHSVYGLLNQYDHLIVERIFMPASSRQSKKSLLQELVSIESNRPISDFDLILLSISFETDYLNVIRIIDATGLSLRADERSDHEPFVFAGGVATIINPEPIAPFIDAFLLGDFEVIEGPFVEELPRLLDTSVSRSERLKKLTSSIPGTYVPQAIETIYDSKGRLKGHNPLWNNEFPVRPAILKQPLEVATHSRIITPDSVFPDMFLVELSRGCGKGCRFCAAGFVYRPPRSWPTGSIKKAVSQCKYTDKVGLVGLEYLSRQDIKSLCGELRERGLKLAFSSLRADSLDLDFAKLLAESGNRTATVAPEAGSQRLRDVINKNLTEDQIISACVNLVEAGIFNIKLYFMLGLPTETDEDVLEITKLVKRIRHNIDPIGKAMARVPEITLSVSTFVPKAWTPFQWVEMTEKRVLERRKRLLKKKIGPLSNTRLRLDRGSGAMIQALLSRGGRSVSRVLELVALKGISWKVATRHVGIKWSSGHFEESERLYWEVVGHRVKRSYLLSEWKKARAGRLTRACKVNGCKACGACT